MGLILRNLMLLVFFSTSTACFKYNWTDTECGLYGDPHIRAFSGAQGRIFLPCRFHAAQLTTKSYVNTACFTNILSFGIVRGAGVYTGGAEIHIKLFNDRYLQHSLLIVISDGILRISGVKTIPSITWGTSDRMQIGSLVFTWTFNGPYVTLSAPFCGLTLVYRTLTLRPSGFIIQAATRNSILYYGYRKYAFCGNQTDVKSMFKDDGLSLDLDTIDQVETFFVITSGICIRFLYTTTIDQ